MKKLFTLGAVFALTMTANADNRKWDFTNWSSETVANLAADYNANGGSNWTSVEKENGDGQTNGNCYWFVPGEETELSTLVDGVETPIKETQGLVFNCSARSLALAVNYQTAWDGMGPFAGPQYLWMGGKNNKFTIKDVKPGATITMEVESHRLTDGRGVSLTVNGTKIEIKEGSETPKEKTKCVWQIPSDISGSNVDVLVTNSNGCHIYYIDLVEDLPELDGTQIAYVYDSKYSGGYDAGGDIVRALLDPEGSVEFSGVTVTDLDVSGNGASTTREDLLKYDVVVISGAIDEGNAFAATLKSAIAYVPMVNCNANLYKDWGYGEAVTTAGGTTTVAELYRQNDLFANIDPAAGALVGTDGSLHMLNSPLVGVSIPAGSYFANDDVLAATDGVTTIHQHNASRNAYLYLPYDFEGMNANYVEETMISIVTNAVKAANFSKTEITKAATPTFEESYKLMNTDVTIKCDTEGAKIYYTTDGSTPTDQSTLYTAPVNVATAGTTVKAVAYADGYDPSEVGSIAVSLFETSVPPTITAEKGADSTTVTITNNQDGAQVYYNFNGNNVTTNSTPYTKPLKFGHPTTIYAFATAVDNKLNSEAVPFKVEVEGKQERLDVMAHFDANDTDWSMGESKTKYYTEGKKNGYDFYELVDSSVVKTPDGRDSTVYVAEPRDVLTEVTPGNGWTARTYGQGMLWENITPSDDVDDSNTANRYRGDTSYDLGATKNSISFGNVRKSNKTENDPYSCFIRTMDAYQGPFDIVTYIGNGSSSNHPKATIWVSNDTTSNDNWVMVGDTVYAGSKQRYIKKNVVSYEGTDKVYVKLQAEFSSVMVFDIILMNAGELTGIKDTQVAEAAGKPVATQVYSLGGTRLAAPAKGINIIREVYADGSVKSRKVVVK